MKKNLFLFVLFFSSCFAIGQILPADYDNAVLQKGLNDSINMYYTTSGQQLVKLAGVEVIDSSLLRLGHYQIINKGLYTASFNAANEMEVSFARVYGGDMNRSPIKLQWAAWGRKTKSLMPQNGAPFPFTMTGSASKPIITPNNTIDTLFGYTVDMYDNPQVVLKVRGEYSTRIKLELIDKNGRTSNVNAPRHYIVNSNRDTLLVFRWDYLPYSSNGFDYKYSSGDYDVVGNDIGLAADGCSKKCWGVSLGRDASTSPLLAGRSGWDGAALLDLHNIVGIAITFDDDNYQWSDWSDWNCSPKLITIKQLIVGDYENSVDLTKENMHYSVSNSLLEAQLLSVSPVSIKQNEQTTVIVKTAGKAFVDGAQRIILFDTAGKPIKTTGIQKINDSTMSFDVKVAVPSVIGKYSMIMVAANGQMFTFDSAVQVDEMALIAPIVLHPSRISTPKNVNCVYENWFRGAMFKYGYPDTIYFKHVITGEVIRTFFSTFLLDYSIDYNDFFRTYINASKSSEGVYDLDFEYMQNGTHLRKIHIDSALTVTAPVEILKPTFGPVQMHQNQICTKTLHAPQADFRYGCPSNVVFVQKGKKIFTANVEVYAPSEYMDVIIDTKNVPVGVYDLQFMACNSSDSVVLPNALTVDTIQKPAITPAIGYDGEWTTIKIAHPGFDDKNSYYLKVSLSKNGVPQFDISKDSIVNDTLYGKVNLYEAKEDVYDLYIMYNDYNGLIRETVRASAFTVSAKKIYELEVANHCTIIQGEKASMVLKLKDAKFKTLYPRVKINHSSSFNIVEVKTLDSVSMLLTFGASNSPAGEYDIDVWEHDEYPGLGSYHYQAKQCLTVTAAPPILYKSLSTNNVVQAKTTELVLTLGNVHLDVTSAYVEFQQASKAVFVPFQTKVLSDSTLSVSILTDAPEGTYDLYVSTYHNGLDLNHIEKAAVSVIPNTKQILTISQDTIYQGKDYYPYVRLPGAHLNEAKNITIEIMKNGKIIARDYVFDFEVHTDSVECSINLGFAPVGEYDLRLSYTNNGFPYGHIYQFTEMSSIKLLESPNPFIREILQDTLVQIGANKVSIRLGCADYPVLNYGSVDLIDRLTQKLTSVKIFSFTDSIITAYFDEEPLTIGLFDLRINTISLSLYKEACIRVIPNKAPKFVSLSPSASMQWQSQRVQLKMENASFTVSAPNEITFIGANNVQISATDITVIDDKTLSFMTSKEGSKGNYDLSFSYYHNGKGKVDITVKSAYSFVDESDIKLLSCTPSNILQGTSVDVFVKGKFTNFDEAFVNHYAVFRSRNAVISPVDSVINDSVMRLRLFVSRYQKLGSYSLELEKSWSEYNQYLGSYQYKSWNYPVLSDAIEVQINDKLPNLVDIETSYAQQGEHVTTVVNGVYTDFIKRPLRIRYFSDDVYQFKPTSSSGLLMIDSVKALNATQMQISFTIPRTANVGRYSLLTYLNDDSLSLPHCFTVIENPNAPRLISVSKHEAKQGDTVCMTILGKGIGFDNSKELILTISKPRIGFMSRSLKIIDENTLETCFIVPDNIDEDTYDVLLNVKEKQSSQGIVEFYTLYDQFTIHATPKKPNQNTIGSSTGSGTGTGIDSQLSNKSTVIYPTTTTDKFTLSSPSAALLEILNLTGQPVMSPSAVFSGETTFDVSELPASVYKVLVTSGDDTKIFTIVKQ